MNGFDLSTVTNIYLGSTPVKEVYMGTKLIWPTDTFDYSREYFTIESLEDYNQIGIVESGRPSIEISTDKQTWTTVTPNAAPTYFITLNAGEKVYIKGSNNAYYDYSWTTPGYFTSTGQFNVSGNIMSLIYGDDFKNKTTLSSSNTDAFAYLFYKANKLITAEHLVLLATTLPDGCYQGMLANCTSLTTAPELPATTLKPWCYSSMFYGCTSLTTAPELPATELADGCYQSMFTSCTSLTKAPYLPATALADYCYQYMFSGCTSFTTAPELPATELADECYAYMFQGCIFLTKAPELPATTLANGCYGYMFSDCSSLTTAPELPAATSTEYCYDHMFYDCKSLNYIKMLATNVSATSCMQYWVYGVAYYGTFVKDASATLPTGSSGIPNGWTVETV